MRTLLLLTAVFGLASWSVAQQNAAQPSSNANQATVRGCLTGALQQYRLVDDDHVVYALVGKDKELSAYDGQQVEVTGEVTAVIPPKEKQTASSFNRPEHRLAVASINKISNTCTGASQ